MYIQTQHSLYNPVRMQIPMLLGEIEVNYIEMLDASCVEFPHSHTDYEIYYCLEGNLTLMLQEKTHVIPARHFVLLPPGTTHGTIYEPHKEKRYFVMVFQLSKHQTTPSAIDYEAAFFENFEAYMQRQLCIIRKDKNRCYHLIDKMQQELEAKCYGWEVLLRGHYLEFIVQILRNFIPPLTQNQKEGDLSTHINMAIKITKFMHANYSHNIVLQDVANHMYVTPRHINRIFQEYFGQSFRKTLSIYRLNYAKNYLLDTEYSVECIAHLVGFSSPQSLYKLFREKEEMTMSEYRTHNKIQRVDIH